VGDAVTELALETARQITADEIHPLDGGVDAAAVAAWNGASELPLASAAPTSHNELTAKLSSLHHTATIAFDVLQGGRVGASGATAALLGRCLREMGDLIGQLK
jgi:hypothetical protein